MAAAWKESVVQVLEVALALAILAGAHVSGLRAPVTKWGQTAQLPNPRMQPTGRAGAELRPGGQPPVAAQGT